MAGRTVAGLIGAGLLTAGLLTSCAKGVGDRPPVTLPSGTQLVAQARFEDGFVPPEWSVISPPRIAVYSDGLAVADSNHMLMLTADEVRDLVRSLRADLDGFGPNVEADPPMANADAPTTVLEVLDPGGALRAVRAYDLEEIDSYPSRLVSANGTLTQLAWRVNRDGKAFTSGRILLVIGGREATGRVPSWPAGVPVPELGPSSLGGVGHLTVDGDAAKAVVQAWPDSVTLGGTWPVARTPGGKVVGIGWRYLLPHEH
jgi:hypothetical protein